MATVYGIVKQNGGFIQVYSEPGKGSTFKIYLPRSAGTAAPVVETESELPGMSNGETVLLVEDEQSILRVGSSMLKKLGYTVLTASTPAEAIRLAENHPGEIHLLLVDVVMPEMNGRQVAARIAELRPGIQCLYMSGDTADVIALHGVLEEGVHFLQKPFSSSTLGAAVREALES